MDSVNFILEVKDLNVVGFVRCRLLFRNSFRINLRILVKIQDRVLSQRLTVEFVGAGLVNPDSTSFCLVRNLSLLDQGLYQVLNSPSLGH